MAKKKRDAPRRPLAQWSQEDDDYLLAWLDHTIKTRDVDFRTTVVSRLGNRYTIKQIKYRLSKLWKYFGPEDEEGQPGNWESDMYSRGSECLINEAHGIALADQARITKWKQEFGDELLAKRLEEPAGGRQLRSLSIGRQKDHSPTRGNLTSSKVSKFRIPPSPRQSAKRDSLTPAVKREIESPLRKGSPAKRARRQHKQRPHAIPKVVPKQQLSPQNQKRQQPERTLSPVINDSEDGENDEDDLERVPDEKGDTEEDQSQAVRCICGATRDVPAPKIPGRKGPAKPTDWTRCTCCNVWQHDLCVMGRFDRGEIPWKYFCERCEPEAHKSREPDRHTPIAGTDTPMQHVISRSTTASIEERSDNEPSESDGILSPVEDIEYVVTTEIERKGLVMAQEMISDLKGEIWQVKLKLELRDITITGLEREASCLKEVQRQRDSQTGIPLEKLMAENLELQKSLSGRLSARQDGAKFATLTGTSRERFGRIKPNNGFYDIYSEAQQILCQRDCENWEFLPSIVQHAKLQKLVSKCLVIELNTHRQMKKATRELLKFTPDAVVRAMATSALLQWVFETDFPQFDKGSSELLTQYRALLGSQDGMIALRNIDLAARDSLTKTLAFQEKEIPETADTLAIELSQTLAPLFSKTPGAKDEILWDGFATWQDDKDEWTGRRKRFVDMFKAALTMKADSCLNVEDYEMVIYPPGTIFDKKTMRTEIIAGMKNPANSYQGRVGLCIEAAVFAHARKRLGHDTPVSEVVATSHNFVRRDERERAHIHPLVKAVVILADA